MSAKLIPLQEAARFSREVVGGKAHGLGTLLERGFSVPTGWVLPVDAVRELAAAEEVPREIDEAIATGRRFAFRSSAVAEDGEDASFAGQFLSVLGVANTEDAREALRRCAAAGCGEAVRDYAERHGVDHGAIALVVQEMVDAEAAGVAFAANPVTGADEVVVEAVRGLGDALLDGSVAPEQWVVGPEGGPRRTVHSDDVLTPEVCGRIAEVCRAISASFGGPQDIEWALRDDEIWILQSRPITALPVDPGTRPPERQTWARDDGHYPGPVPPLNTSFWLPRHRASMTRVAARGGLPIETVDTAVFGGRVYARVVPLGNPPHDDGPVPPKFVFWLLLRLAPPFRARMKCAAEAVRDDLPMLVCGEWESERAGYRARSRELRETPLGDLSDRELLHHLDECSRHIEEVSDAHFEVALLATWPTFGALGRFMEEYGWSPAETLDLLEGHGAASSELGHAVERLAAEIAADEEARALLEEEPAALSDLDSRAGESYREFLDEFGHRLFENDLRTPPWAEDPRALHRLLQSAAQAGEVEHRVDASHAAEERARDVVGARRSELDELLRRARRARPHQDDSENVLAEAFTTVRRGILAAAERLVERAVIRKAEDVWFLEWDEVRDALAGKEITADLDRRRGELRWAIANPPPRVLGPEPGPMPDFPFPRSAEPLLGPLMWAIAAEESEPPADPGDADLCGHPTSPGVVEGTVRVVHSAAGLSEVEQGDVLVCPGTTAAWSFAFGLVAGLVAEVGGPLSHPATLAREFGIPAVLGVEGATTELRTGDRVRIDGAAGRIWKL